MRAAVVVCLSTGTQTESLSVCVIRELSGLGSRRHVSTSASDLIKILVGFGVGFGAWVLVRFWCDLVSGVRIQQYMYVYIYSSVAPAFFQLFFD